MSEQAYVHEEYLHEWWDQLRNFGASKLRLLPNGSIWRWDGEEWTKYEPVNACGREFARTVLSQQNGIDPDSISELAQLLRELTELVGTGDEHE